MLISASCSRNPKWSRTNYYGKGGIRPDWLSLLGIRLVAFLDKDLVTAMLRDHRSTSTIQKFLPAYKTTVSVALRWKSGTLRVASFRKLFRA